MTKVEKFIEELEKLSIKYDLWIAGCGCCSSPWARSLDKDSELPEYRYRADTCGDSGLDLLNPRWKGNESTD